jgi:hypothetical protein
MAGGERRGLVNEDVLVDPAVARVFKGSANLPRQLGPNRTIGRLGLKQHPRASTVKANSQKGLTRKGTPPRMGRVPTVAHHGGILIHYESPRFSFITAGSVTWFPQCLRVRIKFFPFLQDRPNLLDKKLELALTSARARVLASVGFAENSFGFVEQPVQVCGRL